MPQSTFLAYAKNPPNKINLPQHSIEHHESNRLCGDSITVQLLIKEDTVIDFGFSGDTALVTTAAASMVGEAVCGMVISDIFTWRFEQVKELLDVEISQKRIPASCLGLLAIRNALHNYLQDGKRDDFSDVLPD